MLLLENKYGLFKKITYDKKSEYYKNELKEYDEKLSEELSSFEKDLEEKTKKSIRKEQHNLEINKNEKVQILKNKSREAILKLREELIDDLSEELSKKYVDYVKTEEYFNKTYKEIESYLNDKDNTVYLIEEDVKKLNNSEYKDRIKTMSNDEIGGFIVENEKNNTIVNNSIKEFIKADRNTIGLIVQEFINKVGAEIE